MIVGTCARKELPSPLCVPLFLSVPASFLVPFSLPALSPSDNTPTIVSLFILFSHPASILPIEQPSLQTNQNSLPWEARRERPPPKDKSRN